MACGGHGGTHAQQVEPVAGGETGGDELQVGLELRNAVLTHGEERPAPAVPEDLAQLREERRLRVVVDRVEREELLELVEDQAHVAVRLICGDDSVEVGREVGLSVGSTEVGRSALFVQGEHRAGQVAVRRARTGRDVVADPDSG